MRLLPAKLLLAFLCFCLLTGKAAAETPRQLVVVSSVDSPIQKITKEETRRAFMAIPTVISGIRLKPLRNESDPQLREVFLQKVIFMSKSKYEKRLVSQIFRSGGNRPSVFEDTAELIAELARSPEAITYMWSNQISESDRVRIIGVLWKGSQE